MSMVKFETDWVAFENHYEDGQDPLILVRIKDRSADKAMLMFMDIERILNTYMLECAQSRLGKNDR